MLLTRASVVMALLASTAALAQRESSRDALLRFEESMAARQNDGALSKDFLPAIVVSVTPAYEETKAWYPTAALKALVHVFGSGGLRSCEACMAPRLFIEEGRLEQSSGALSTGEISRLDEQARGKAAPARIAIWLDETRDGVTLRIIDLQNGHLLMAENFDRTLKEAAATQHTWSLAREFDRRARGDALTHTFFDFALYPGQHVSLDFAEQWGDTNSNISGVSLSIFDPLLGVGISYFRVIPQAFNLMVGAKVLLSVPTAIVSGLSQQVTTVIDPLLTGVLMVRFPIASSNYGLILSLSTNGRVGLGFSLMNISFLPFLP